MPIIKNIEVCMECRFRSRKQTIYLGKLEYWCHIQMVPIKRGNLVPPLCPMVLEHVVLGQEEVR